MCADVIDSATEASVCIGERRIGAGEPTYIIAEAGVNHGGSVETALRLVDIAVEAGADAVKFQVFRAADLATTSARKAAYQSDGGAESQREMLARLELSDREFRRVRDHCAASGIEFLATPFSQPDSRRVLELGVRAFKIASTDLNNTPLLREIAASGLPMIVSTGAATTSEIRESMSRLFEWGVGKRLILLHCVSSYPTPIEAANLRAIDALRREFGAPCGYSDHTTSTQIGAWAVAAGADILEKHFTYDRSATGPDHAMSLDATGLREYVSQVREVERALGAGLLGMTDLEDDVRAAARKSIVAARPLTAGTVIAENMLVAKRPGGGITPDRIDELLGRKVAVDLPADARLTWEIVQ